VKTFVNITCLNLVPVFRGRHFIRSLNSIFYMPGLRWFYRPDLFSIVSQLVDSTLQSPPHSLRVQVSPILRTPARPQAGRVFLGEPYPRLACWLQRLAATNFMHVPSQWSRPEKVRDGGAPSPTREARVLPRMNGFAVCAGSEMRPFTHD